MAPGSLDLILYGAERVGPLNQTGEMVYKVFGRGRRPDGKMLMVACHTNQGTYEKSCEQLLRGEDSHFTALAANVLSLQVQGEDRDAVADEAIARVREKSRRSQ